jgi:hypothetical protein
MKLSLKFTLPILFLACQVHAQVEKKEVDNLIMEGIPEIQASVI